MMATTTVPKRTSLMTPLVTTAGVLGIIQGLGWTLCSIFAILIHTDILSISKPKDMATIGDIIQEIYLTKNDNKTSEIIIGSREFSYFVYIYLVLSFFWLLVSSVLLWASITGKGEKIYDKAIGGWTLTASLLSLLDLILMCLIAHDYNVIAKLTDNSLDLNIVLAAVGIVMTLAARGFVLWIINVIFAIILGKYCYGMYKDANNQNRTPIDAYASRPVPWLDPSLYNDNDDHTYDNKAYKDDDNSITPNNFMEDRNLNFNNKYNNINNRFNNRELPQINPRKLNANNNYWNNPNRIQNKPNLNPYSEAESITPYAQTAPVRTAKIGRQGGQRSPPLNVAPPFIPAPDYSPPGSPKVRGVLRPKSNYADYNMY